MKKNKQSLSLRNRKIFIFAFDGLPLNLARKLANDGLMPNLAFLFKKGWWGNLESSLPPLTAPAWASFATGKNPGSHGIFNFLQPKTDLNDLGIVSSRDIKGRTFYEILGEKEKRVIFINLPCSYPSRIKKGILISSFLAGEDFFYPRDLIKEIPELAKYKVAPDFAIGLNIEKGLGQILEIEKNRFVCGQKLFQKDWDCFFYLFSGTDWAMHLAFGELIKGQKVNPQVKKIFRKADLALGWFLKNLPKNTTVLVVSDHGFSTFSQVFYINAWLKKKKFLDFKHDWRKIKPRALTEILITKARPESFQGRTFRRIALFFINNPVLYSLLVRLIRIASFVFPESIPEHLLNMGLEIDPRKTKAYALPGSGGWFGLFINDKRRFRHGVVSKKDYPKLCQKIYKELVHILGENKVWLKEKIYDNQGKERAPDILYSPKDIFVSPAFSRRIFANKKGNSHSRLGFFLISNREIKRGKKVEGLKIIDLAPNILYYFNIKPPAGMRKRILKPFKQK